MPSFLEKHVAYRNLRARLRHKFTHTLLRGADGEATMAVFGEDNTSHRMAGLYLGGKDEPAQHRCFNGAGGWESTALKLMNRHGLVYIFGKHPTPKLAPYLLTQLRFVALDVDICATEAEFCKAVSHARKDISKVRNRGFVVEFERDPAWSHEFHRRFHQPAMLGRHGVEAYIMSAADIEHHVRHHKAEFLCIVHDGRRIVANLIEPTPDGVKLMRLGWLDGDYAHVKTGAVDAVYWFSFAHARSLGARRVQLGGTPPFIDSGVMKYKLKWNPGIMPEPNVWGEYHLLLRPEHPDVQSMFGKSAFILKSADGGNFVLSGGRPDDYYIGEHMRGSIAAWYRLLPSPDPAHSAENTLLPESLRPWAVRESPDTASDPATTRTP